MNRYYAVLFEPVKRHGGLVQDVVGDSMLAVWATTEPDLSLRSRACLAALDIASAVDRFNAASGRLALPTRIGLHSGQLLLGSVGAMDHYEYRAVGDIVNTATRLEGLNKHLGTRLLVSADVLQGLEGLMSRELGAFLLAGKSRPIVVHELIARAADATAGGQGAVCYLCRGSRRLPAWSLARGHAALGRSAPRARRRGWAKPLLPPMVRDARRRAAARRLGRRRAHGPEVAGEPRDRPRPHPRPRPRRRSSSPPLPSPAAAADCQDWVARTVSIQGRVEARRAGEPQWLPVQTGAAHCLGDAVRLGPLSRAAIAPARRRRGAPRPEHHDHVHAAAGTRRYLGRPPDRSGPFLQPDAAPPPRHDAVRQRVGRGNRVPGRGGPDRGAHLRVGGAGPRRERAGLARSRGRAVGGGARRAGADAPADRGEARRRRGLGSLLSAGPRPSSGGLPGPARRDLAAAGPPLHRGSRPRRPRRRAGQRRGHPGHRHRAPGVRTPGRRCSSPWDEWTRRVPTSTGRSHSRRSSATRSRSGPSWPWPGTTGRPRARWPSRRSRPTRDRPPPTWRSPTPSRRPSTSTARSRASSRRCSSGPGNALAHARLAELWLVARRPRPRARGRRPRPRASIRETPEPRRVLGFTALTQIRRREAAEAFERAIAARSGGALASARLGSDARSAAATSRGAGTSSRSRSAWTLATPSCAAISARPTTRSGSRSWPPTSSSSPRSWTRTTRLPGSTTPSGSRASTGPSRRSSRSSAPSS